MQCFLAPTPAQGWLYSTHMSVTITLATPEDWSRTRDLRLAALTDSPDAFLHSLAEEERQPPSFWVDRIHRATATLMASISGRDVGIAVVAPLRDSPGDAGLFGVWVNPDARGQGVGDALMEHAAKVARNDAFRRILLEVGDHNTAAVRLYERSGYVPTGHTARMDPPRAHITEHERVLVL